MPCDLVDKKLEVVFGLGIVSSVGRQAAVNVVARPLQKLRHDAQSTTVYNGLKYDEYG
jgi:hypothetical protein